MLILFSVLQYLRLSCIDKLYDKTNGLSFYLGRKICYINDKETLFKIINNTKYLDTIVVILMMCGTVLYLFYNK